MNSSHRTQNSELRTPNSGALPANSPTPALRAGEPRVPSSAAQPRTQNPELRTQPLAGEPRTQNAERQDAACGRILAGIPCLNTAAHITDVVTATLQYVDEVVVVDDGSTDNTGALAAQAGATVLTHEHNMGVGAALRTLFEYASEHDAKVLVTVDGDGQHFPEDIPGLIAPVLEGRASMVLGSRFLQENHGRPIVQMPRYRAFGIHVITFLFNVASGCRVTDSQCGLRAYDASALRELSPIANGFEWSVELPVRARARGMHMIEVPVGCVYHEDGSTMNPVRQGVRLAVAVVRLRANAVLARWRRRLTTRKVNGPGMAVTGQEGPGTSSEVHPS